MSADLPYQIALKLLEFVGDVHAKLLVEHFGNAKDIFNARQSELERIAGIGSVRARNIKKFKNYEKVESELEFIDRYKIQPLFYTDQAYPRRLRNCFDPPVLLFFKGNADLNTSHFVSVVGTRSNSEYGRTMTENFVSGLAEHDATIVSGLAFGIDSIAHKVALRNGMPTIAVVAHGLQLIYPFQHISLAREIMKCGGILTEFLSGTKPDKHNFPSRNRIVAGLSDGVVVIESGIKGGSIITAELGFGYDREIFAFPGRVSDAKSSGCNELIRSNKASLLTSARHFVESMGWCDFEQSKTSPVKQLFPLLTGDEQKLFDILVKSKISVDIDSLSAQSGLSSTKLAAALLNMQMQNIVESVPGKRYRLSQ
jgi:DNA processing protein